MFSFHPFTSVTRTITDPDKLRPEETYLTIEIRADHLELLAGMPISKINVPLTIKSRQGKVSELPEGHPAVSTLIKNSVRVT